jgi:hypothetical protein
MPRLRAEISPREAYTAREILEMVGHSTLTVTEVAGWLGVHRDTARKWLRSVDAVMVNGKPRYQAIDLARKVEACRREGASV